MTSALKTNCTIGWRFPDSWRRVRSGGLLDARGQDLGIEYATADRLQGHLGRQLRRVAELQKPACFRPGRPVLRQPLFTMPRIKLDSGRYWSASELAGA